MKFTVIYSLIATLCLTAMAYAQAPEETTPEEAKSPAEARPWVDASVEPVLELQPVPKIMRMHLPLLDEQRGMLVVDVPAGSTAEKVGLLPGDLLLEASGKGVVENHAIGKLNPLFPTVVLRRGRTQVLPVLSPDGFKGVADFSGVGGFPGHFMRNAPKWNRPPVMNGGPGAWGKMPKMPMPKMPTAQVIASAFAGGFGSQAMSVSRAGDQISLEMTLPELNGESLRMKGTASEILGELAKSSLSEAAKQQIRSAIGL